MPIARFWDEQLVLEESDPRLPGEEAMVIRRKMIGVLLLQARMAKHKTRQDCARSLDCPSSRIARYELGRTDIPLVHLEVLADLCGVSMDYFLQERLLPPTEVEVAQETMASLAQLPPEVRTFVLNPLNVLYLRIAMRLSDLQAEALREIAETLLDITY